MSRAAGGDGAAVPAIPVTEHLMRLRAYGIGFRRLAELAGCSPNHIRAIHDGYRTRHGVREPITSVRASHARRILAIKPDQRFCGPMDRLDCRGASRRLQALFANGWGGRLLAERVGTSMSYLNTMAAGRVFITPERDWIIRRLYDELWDQEPPRRNRNERSAYTRALSTAEKHGWARPMDWDDIDTDEAPQRPEAPTKELVDEVKVQLAYEGRTVELSSVERIEVIRKLHAARVNDREIGERVGLQQSAVFRIRKQHGIRNPGAP